MCGLGPDRKRPPSATDLATAQLHAMIQARQLQPGERLGREEELAAELGVSRFVLREALRQLESTRLIRRMKGPGGGVIVANTFEASIGRSVSDSVARLLNARALTPRELLEARVAIEVPLTGAAALAVDADALRELSSSVSRAEEALPDGERVASCGATFHRMIGVLGGNRIVESITAWMFDVLQPELDRLSTRIDDRAVVDQHREILHCIERRDAAAAEEAMSHHLEYLGKLARVF